MYTVIGDITIFHGMDRWGSHPIRKIAECRTYIGAMWKAYRHTVRHPHGSAWIEKGVRPDLKLAS